MDRFLRPSSIIDHEDPGIRSLARELASGSAGDAETARRCFLWVRDQVRHSSDHGLSVVTCTASEVLRHRAGICYAKSHLLAALLRSCGIPAALCYQRLSQDGRGEPFCLHGLVAVHLRRHGWYRVDPRGDKPGIRTDFQPPAERLAYIPSVEGEMDVPGYFPDPLPDVVSALRRWEAADAADRPLPDYAPWAGRDPGRPPSAG